MAAAAAGGNRGAGHAAAEPAARSVRPALREVSVRGGSDKAGVSALDHSQRELGLREVREGSKSGILGVPVSDLGRFGWMEGHLGLVDPRGPGSEGPGVRKQTLWCLSSEIVATGQGLARVFEKGGNG